MTREYFIDYSMIHLVIVVLTNSCVFFSLHNWVSIIFPLVILRINCWVVVYTYLYELSQGVFKLLGSLGTTEVELGQVITLTGHPIVVILACKWYFIVCFTRLAMSSDDSWPLVINFIHWPSHWIMRGWYCIRERKKSTVCIGEKKKPIMIIMDCLTSDKYYTCWVYISHHSWQSVWIIEKKHYTKTVSNHRRF